VNLLCTQSWHAVVGGGPATVTWHAGKMPVRPSAAQRPYRARLANKVAVVGARWSYSGGEGAMRAQGEAEWPMMASVALRCGQCEGGRSQWRVRESEGMTEPSRAWSPYARAKTLWRGPNDGQRQPHGSQALALVGHHSATRNGHQSFAMNPDSAI